MVLSDVNPYSIWGGGGGAYSPNNYTALINQISLIDTGLLMTNTQILKVSIHDKTISTST